MRIRATTCTGLLTSLVLAFSANAQQQPQPPANPPGGKPAQARHPAQHTPTTGTERQFGLSRWFGGGRAGNRGIPEGITDATERYFELPADKAGDFIVVHNKRILAQKAAAEKMRKALDASLREETVQCVAVVQRESLGIMLDAVDAYHTANDDAEMAFLQVVASFGIRLPEEVPDFTLRAEALVSLVPDLTQEEENAVKSGVRERLEQQRAAMEKAEKAAGLERPRDRRDRNGWIKYMRERNKIHKKVREATDGDVSAKVRAILAPQHAEIYDALVAAAAKLKSDRKAAQDTLDAVLSAQGLVDEPGNGETANAPRGARF